MTGGRVAELGGIEQRGGNVHDSCDKPLAPPSPEVDAAGLPPALLLSFERIPEALSHEADFLPRVTTDNLVESG